ncbi:MAG: RNA-binding protein, partial [Methylocella sp.]
MIGNAVKVMRIATGEEPEDFGPKSEKNQAAAELGRIGGKKRAEGMTPERRAEIARGAAAKRWENKPKC